MTLICMKADNFGFIIHILMNNAYRNTKDEVKSLHSHLCVISPVQHTEHYAEIHVKTSKLNKILDRLPTRLYLLDQTQQ